MVNLTNLVCEECGVAFTRRTAEVNRNARKGRKTFCSSSCTGKFWAKTYDNFGDKKHAPFSGHTVVNGRKRDEYSMFKEFFRSSRANSNDTKTSKEHSITLQDLKEQWEKQKGICPYTGWTLKIKSWSGQKLEKTTDRASLDRIDSSKGYIKGNIQFVSLIAQYAKNGWDETVIKTFCEAVVKNLAL